MKTKYIIMDMEDNCATALERISKELRSIVIFKEEDAAFFPLKGDEYSLRFFTLSFDYPTNSPRIIDVSYNFENDALSKSIRDPFEEEPNTFKVLQDLKKLKFYYFDNSEEEDKWQEKWEDIKDLPTGLRIDLIYEDDKGKEVVLSKYVYIDR